MEFERRLCEVDHILGFDLTSNLAPMNHFFTKKFVQGLAIEWSLGCVKCTPCGQKRPGCSAGITQPRDQSLAHSQSGRARERERGPSPAFLFLFQSADGHRRQERERAGFQGLSLNQSNKTIQSVR